MLTFDLLSKKENIHQSELLCVTLVLVFPQLEYSLEHPPLKFTSVCEKPFF